MSLTQDSEDLVRATADAARDKAREAQSMRLMGNLVKHPNLPGGGGGGNDAEGETSGSAERQPSGKKRAVVEEGVEGGCGDGGKAKAQAAACASPGGPVSPSKPPAGSPALHVSPTIPRSLFDSQSPPQGPYPLAAPRGPSPLREG